MATDSRPGKSALIIVGMHRSGTSATTGALQCLGVQLGRKLYGGHAHINAKGYFEHSDIADTNDEALLALGSAWDDVLVKEDGWWQRDCLARYAQRIRKYIRRDFADSPLWAVKDPRVCRLLPWWLQILATEGVEPCFLFVLRSPAEVFRSLHRRDGFSRDKAYLLWILHYLEAERWSRGRARAVIAFERFLDQPRAEFERVERELGLAFPLSPSAAASCLDQFISQDLRHHQESAGHDAESPILTLAHDLYTILMRATRESQAALAPEALDELQRRLDAIQKGFPQALTDHLRSISSARGNSLLTLNRLVRSWSWFTGKPVRFVERWFGRDV